MRFREILEKIEIDNDDDSVDYLRSTLILDLQDLFNIIEEVSDRFMIDSSLINYDVAEIFRESIFNLHATLSKVEHLSPKWRNAMNKLVDWANS